MVENNNDDDDDDENCYDSLRILDNGEVLIIGKPVPVGERGVRREIQSSDINRYPNGAPRVPAKLYSTACFKCEAPNAEHICSATNGSDIITYAEKHEMEPNRVPTDAVRPELTAICADCVKAEGPGIMVRAPNGGWMWPNGMESIGIVDASVSTSGKTEVTEYDVDGNPK